ncbi:asparaginase [Anaerosacchariphilus polymeriproducens]|uniref:asparaginase n=1 Tax=Anaerosacchariphilus polymeriproducens TaxID=1812858 RepID=A0A371AZT1_9FIRM|nr:asparaginase [Anaerosacchariphilus polymeriproducens]RDU25002.1 asparaginase [Anaerosacchariphilus polymeriproducens]
MKKILLLATGGTIASSETEQGLIPTIDAQQMLSYIPEIEEICYLSGISIMNVDSTNMNPKLMAKIAAAIYSKYQEYDGFVVTHGTDTMGYTAAALTYMLQNIKKPVVVTGSQIAIKALNTDAKKNLTDAIRFANEDFPGIFVAFDSKIMYGTYAVKVKTRSTDSFQSINFPTVAEIKEGKIIYNSILNNDEYRDKFKSHELKLQTNLCEDILILKIFPGIKPHIFDYIKDNYKGVIIESFGIGGIPNADYDIVSKVQELIQAGLAVVITTQCLCEGIDLSIYAVGKILTKYKIIYAGDMTTEAATMKLMWALGNLKDFSSIKDFMEGRFL